MLLLKRREIHHNESFTPDGLEFTKINVYYNKLLLYPFPIKPAKKQSSSYFREK